MGIYLRIIFSQVENSARYSNWESHIFQVEIQLRMQVSSVRILFFSVMQYIFRNLSFLVDDYILLLITKSLVWKKFYFLVNETLNLYLKAQCPLSSSINYYWYSLSHRLLLKLLFHSFCCLFGFSFLVFFVAVFPSSSTWFALARPTS